MDSSGEGTFVSAAASFTASLARSADAASPPLSAWREGGAVSTSVGSVKNRAMANVDGLRLASSS